MAVYRDENLDQEYQEILERKEERGGILSNIPKKALIVFGIVIVIIIAYASRSYSDYKGVFFAVLATIAIIIFLAYKDKKSAFDYLGEEEIIPIAKTYLEKKVFLLKDEFRMYEDGKWFLTGQAVLRTWDSQPWIWYVYWDFVSQSNKKHMWFASLFDPYSGKCMGTQEYTTKQLASEMPHIRVYRNWHDRMESQFKMNPTGGGITNG